MNESKKRLTGSSLGRGLASCFESRIGNRLPSSLAVKPIKWVVCGRFINDRYWHHPAIHDAIFVAAKQLFTTRSRNTFQTFAPSRLGDFFQRLPLGEYIKPTVINTCVDLIYIDFSIFCFLDAYSLSVISPCLCMESNSFSLSVADCVFVAGGLLVAGTFAGFFTI